MLLDWFFIHLTKSCGETFQMKNLSVVLLRIPFLFVFYKMKFVLFQVLCRPGSHQQPHFLKK